MRRHQLNLPSPVIESLLVSLGELDPARFHLDQAAARQDEIGIFGALVLTADGDADAVFEGGTLRQGIGVVAEGREEIEEKSLRLALFVALDLGGELGEVSQGLLEMDRDLTY